MNIIINSIQQMVKQIEESKVTKHSKTKVDRFQKIKNNVEEEALDDERRTWKTVSHLLFRVLSFIWDTSLKDSKRNN